MRLHLHDGAAAGHLRGGDRGNPPSQDIGMERERQQERAAKVKSVLGAASVPFTLSDTHIVPVMVSDPEKCKPADQLSQGTA